MILLDEEVETLYNAIKNEYISYTNEPLLALVKRFRQEYDGIQILKEARKKEFQLDDTLNDDSLNNEN